MPSGDIRNRYFELFEATVFSTEMVSAFAALILVIRLNQLRFCQHGGCRSLHGHCETDGKY